MPRAFAPFLRVAVWGIYALFVLVALQQLVINSNVINMSDIHSSGYRMLQRTADRPYVYRQLLPAIARTTNKLTPQPIVDAINETAADGFDLNPKRNFLLPKRIQNTLSKYSRSFYPMCILLTLMYACFIGYGIVMYHSTRALYPEYPLAKYTVLFLAVAFAMPYLHYRMTFKVYDIPAMFFAAAYLLALLKRSVGWMLLIFAMATINKESIIFLLPACLLVLYREWPKAKLWQFMAVQFVLWAIILIIRNEMLDHIRGSMIYITYVRSIPEFMKSFLKMDYLESLALLTIFLLYRFWQKPYFVRAALITFALTLIGYIFFGMPGEYRVFTEALPAATLAIIHSLFSLIGPKRSPEEQFPAS